MYYHKVYYDKVYYHKVLSQSVLSQKFSFQLFQLSIDICRCENDSENFYVIFILSNGIWKLIVDGQSYLTQ